MSYRSKNHGFLTFNFIYHNTYKKIFWGNMYMNCIESSKNCKIWIISHFFCVGVALLENCSNVGQIRLQFGQKWVHLISRISRNFSREMGHFFSHLARNENREKYACLITILTFHFFREINFGKVGDSRFAILKVSNSA